MKTAFFCGGSKTRAENSDCWQGDVSSKSYRESRNDSFLARDPERNDTEWLQCSVSGGKYADKGQWISFKSKPSINPARERHGSYWSVGRLKSTPSFPSSLYWWTAIQIAIGEPFDWRSQCRFCVVCRAVMQRSLGDNISPPCFSTASACSTASVITHTHHIPAQTGQRGLPMGHVQTWGGKAIEANSAYLCESSPSAISRCCCLFSLLVVWKPS